AACQGIRRVPSGGIGECRTSKLNSRYSYLNNVTIRVPINKNWRPFTEIGYVSYNDPADDNPYPNDWQWRWRVGIEYIF
ncbi:oligogalacturonate-specific porin KdgM family protein, partial [Aeromonas rivipollensis]|uniref:oligogalacturonate-specific porin KdgM family protein n=1 Tax=Aeromonas rivipollensis TaxID=948519 RepID=UPI003D1ED3D2